MPSSLTAAGEPVVEPDCGGHGEGGREHRIVRVPQHPAPLAWAVLNQTNVGIGRTPAMGYFFHLCSGGLPFMTSTLEGGGGCWKSRKRLCESHSDKTDKGEEVNKSKHFADVINGSPPTAYSVIHPLSR